MITSPPYNVTKTYDQNLTLAQYLQLLEDALKECCRVLKSTGVIALNIANVGRKPYIPLDTFVIDILQRLKCTVFQEIIWDKEASAGGSCAWGSWQSASNPSLRDVHEYIILAAKGTEFDQIFQPIDFEKIPGKIENRSINIDRAEYTTNFWKFQTESAKRVHHPAPFPVELPLRLIYLFTQIGDLVLDSFIGSGTVAIAAIASKRHYVGYEIDSEFVQLAQNVSISIVVIIVTTEDFHF